MEKIEIRLNHFENRHGSSHLFTINFRWVYSSLAFNKQLSVIRWKFKFTISETQWFKGKLSDSYLDVSILNIKSILLIKKHILNCARHYLRSLLDLCEWITYVAMFGLLNSGNKSDVKIAFVGRRANGTCLA